MSHGQVVVGIDNGATKNNATVLTLDGRYLVDRMHEVPSRVADGPAVAVEAMVAAMDIALQAAGVAFDGVAAVGLDTPGPRAPTGSSAAGRDQLRPAGVARLRHPGRPRGANRSPGGLQQRRQRGRPVCAPRPFRGAGREASSVTAVVGTGLGGGVIEAGRVIRGAAGQAGELGHIRIPLDGILDDGQPIPTCGCGHPGDVESIASLTGIGRNLLPYWLARHPEHPLARLPPIGGCQSGPRPRRGGDPMARRIFAQQAMALGRLFTIAANFTDPLRLLRRRRRGGGRARVP